MTIQADGRRRRMNPHVSAAIPPKRLKRMCAKKVPHSCLSDAQDHATRLNEWKVERAAVKPWTPYLCPMCSHYHVGRRPDDPTVLSPEPFDATMYDVLGDRAYFCGLVENTGRKSNRLRAIRQRARAAVKRAYLRSQERPPT